MAIRLTPTIRTVISGDGISTIDTAESFTLSEKLEAQYILNDETIIEIPFSFVDTIQSIVFNSSSEYNVVITDTDLNVITIGVSGLFKFNPTEAYRATISKIEISTSSETDITVTAYIYGVA